VITGSHHDASGLKLRFIGAAYKFYENSTQALRCCTAAPGACESAESAGAPGAIAARGAAESPGAAGAAESLTGKSQ